MGKTQTTKGPRPDNATAQAAGTAAVLGDAEDARPTAAEIEKRTPKQYRATARGYAEGRIIEAGETFTTKADKGSWMEPLGKDTRSARERAVDDTLSPISDDPDLTTFSKEALEAEALRYGLTNAKGLSKDDLIAAIKAAHDEERAR